MSSRYLNNLRGTSYTGVPQNPTVISKSVKRYGESPNTGAIQGSTGEQPVKQIERGLGCVLPRVFEKVPEPVKVERLDYFGKPVRK